MSSNYNKFLSILKKWPPNPNRSSRDYGYRLRQLVNQCSENGGNPFPGTTKENEIKLDSLHRIADDYYNKKYVHNLKIGATGRDLKYLSTILNDDTMKGKIRTKKKQ